MFDKYGSYKKKMERFLGHREEISPDSHQLQLDVSRLFTLQAFQTHLEGNILE